METYERGSYPNTITSNAPGETLYGPDIDCLFTFNAESESETVLGFSSLVIDDCGVDGFAVSACMVIEWRNLKKKIIYTTIQFLFKPPIHVHVTCILYMYTLLVQTTDVNFTCTLYM